MTFLLSHYTNMAGLEGIAKTQTIRATRYLTLNDKLEYEFAWKQLLDAAQNYALDLLPEDLRGIARNIGLPKVLQNQLLDRSSESSYGHLYVTSFALSDDKYDETRLRTH